MVKRDKSKKSTDQQSFSDNPFKRLKGLSFSAGGAESSRNVLTEVNKRKTAGDTPDKDQSFTDEMDLLGVKPLGRSPCESEEFPAEKPNGAGHTPNPKPRTRGDRDRQEFLNAIGTLDHTFTDAWPETEPEAPQRAAPRRMRQVERGQLRPEAELDLHGYTRDEALHRVRCFLENAVHHGYSTVLLITGKGHHSQDGPVLRDAVEQLLGSLRQWVLEWGLAPRRYGGDGALMVFLRQKPQGSDEQ